MILVFPLFSAVHILLVVDFYLALMTVFGVFHGVCPKLGQLNFLSKNSNGLADSLMLNVCCA